MKIVAFAKYLAYMVGGAEKSTYEILKDEAKKGNEIELISFDNIDMFKAKDKKIELQNRYQSGKEGYGHFKKYLKDLIWSEFEEAREKRAYYLEHQDIVRDILNDGANKMRKIADAKMATVREAVGIL
jgi:tryptophanyl-tRNA synthetase